MNTIDLLFAAANSAATTTQSMDALRASSAAPLRHSKHAAKRYGGTSNGRAFPSPNNSAVSSFPINNSGAGAYIVNSVFDAATEAETAKGEALFARGMERFQTIVRKKMGLLPPAAAANSSPSSSFVSPAAIAMAKEVSSAKAPIVLLPAWSAVEVTTAFVTSVASTNQNKSSATISDDTTTNASNNSNKVLLIEPAAQIIAGQTNQFLAMGALEVAVTEGAVSGGGGNGSGIIVAGEANPCVCRTSALEVTMALKRWLSLEADKYAASRSANNSKKASASSPAAGESAAVSSSADSSSSSSEAVVVDQILNSPLSGFGLIVVQRAHQMSIETQALLCVIREVLRITNLKQKQHQHRKSNSSNAAAVVPTLPKVAIALATAQHGRIIEYFAGGGGKSSAGSCVAIATGTAAAASSPLAVVNCHEAAGIAAKTAAVNATINTSTTAARHHQHHAISTVRLVVNDAASVQKDRDALKAAQSAARKAKAEARDLKKKARAAEKEKEREKKEGGADDAAASSSSDDDDDDDDDSDVEVDATPEATAIAIRNATAQFNPRFVRNACDNLLGPLLTKVATSALATISEAEQSSAVPAPSPMIVIYTDTNGPYYEHFFERLRTFASQMEASSNGAVMVKWKDTIQKMSDLIDADAAAKERLLAKDVDGEDAEMKDGAKPAKSVLYVLVLGNASQLAALETIRNVAVAGVIDFGTSNAVSMDGDADNKLNKKILANPHLANSLAAKMDVNSPVAFKSCEWATLEQVELRALSAGDGGLYIQLIPEEIVRPIAAAAGSEEKKDTDTAEADGDAAMTRAAVLPTSLLPLVRASRPTNRQLLALLRVPLTNTPAFCFAPYAFPFPPVVGAAVNSLLSLGLIMPCPSATYTVTALGELVSTLFPVERVSCEAAYAAVVLAAMGKPELGAAIATALSAPLTSRADLSRPDFALEEAKGSDALADVHYLLSELKRRYEAVDATVATTATLKPYTSKRRLAAATELYQTILRRMREVAFVESFTASSSAAATSSSAAAAAFALGKAPSAIIADLTKNTLVVSCALAAAFAANVAMVSKSGQVTPLYFKTSGRDFTVASISSSSANNKAAAEVDPRTGLPKSGLTTPQFGSLVSLSPTSTGANSAAATAITNKVIIPTSYALAPSPNAKSLLSNCTVMRAELFFAAVACLRPALSCLGEAVAEMARAAGVDLAAAAGKAGGAMGIPTFDPSNPFAAANAATTFRMMIHGRSYFTCSNADADAIIKARMGVANCAQLLLEKRQMRFNRLVGEVKKLKKDGATTMAVLPATGAFASSSAPSADDNTDANSVSSFISYLRAQSIVDYPATVANTLRELADCLPEVKVNDVIKYDSINYSVQPLQPAPAPALTPSAQQQGQKNRKYFSKFNKRSKKNGGGGGMNHGNGPIFADPYIDVSYPPAVSLPRYAADGEPSASMAAAAAAAVLIADQAIPSDVNAVTAALANASKGKRAVGDITSTFLAAAAAATSSSFSSNGGSKGSANPSALAAAMMASMRGGPAPRPSGGAPTSGEQYTAQLSIASEMVKALCDFDSDDEEDYGAYYDEDTLGNFAARGPIMDDDDE